MDRVNGHAKLTSLERCYRDGLESSDVLLNGRYKSFVNTTKKPIPGLEKASKFAKRSGLILRNVEGPKSPACAASGMVAVSEASVVL